MRYIYALFFTLIFFTPLSANSTVSSLAPHYLYQFANNIQKSNSSDLYHIHIISPTSKVKQNFQRVLLNKKVNSKKFLITTSKNFQLPSDTNMLYLSKDSKVSFSKISNLLEGKPVLLISFNQKDKKRVMINLFITKDKKLSFEINRANILNEGFSISDKVVLMGGTELDVAKLFKGAKKSLYKKELELKRQEEKLSAISQKTKKLEEQNTLKEKKLKIAQKKLKGTQVKVKKLVKNLKDTLKNLKKTKQNLLSEKKIFKLQKIKNKKLQTELITTTINNNKMKSELAQTLQDIKKRETALVQLNETILSKEKELVKLNKRSLTQDTQIKKQEGTIDTQQHILMLTFIAIAIFIVFVILIIIMYQKQHKISQKLTLTLKELQETQEELIQSAKMASLGELVSGLAHEMNTPIGVAITGISVLQNTRSELETKLTDKKLKESDLVSFFKLTTKLSESINVSLQRAAQLIRSFKQVSVDQQVEVLREFNLKEYLDTILISLKPQFKHSDIQINLEVDDNIVLNSYPGIYYQIITNLINNTLLHGFEKQGHGTIFIEAKVSKKRLLLVYKDDGKGVSEKNISHIFEPFFTTKRANGGTGLGLHIIYNLITQKLAGSIKASSKEGEGLTLSMNFPLVVD